MTLIARLRNVLLVVGTLMMAGFASLAYGQAAPAQGTISVSSGTVLVGQNFTMTLTITNPSSVTTLGQVSATVNIPAGLQLLSTVAGTCPGATANSGAGVSNGTVPSLAPLANCSLLVATVSATASGTYTFTGSMTTLIGATPVNSTPTPASVQAFPISVTLSPPSLTFPAQNVSTTSAPQILTLTNNSTFGVTSIGTVSATGDFSAATTCPAVLPSGQSCTSSVTFTPTAVGTRTGTFTILVNGQPVTASLTGTGTAPPVPVASLSPPSLSFGDLSLGSVSAPQTVTLTNTGNANLNLGTITVTGQYTFGSNCPASVPVGVSCQITVHFNPVTAGNAPGTLTIPSNAATSPDTVALSGFASRPPGVSIAIPATMTPGQTATLSLVVSNANTGGGTFSGMAGAIDVPAGFTLAAAPVAPTCVGATSSIGAATLSGSGGSAAPGVTCTLASAGITAPTAPGSYTFTIPAFAFTMANPYGYANSLDITATVTVAAATTLTVAPTSLAFGNQAVGTTSAPQSVTLTNGSTVPVAIAGVATTAGFAATSGCPASLAAGASCTIAVRFTPTAPGAVTGSLTFTGNGTIFTVSLSGTGVTSSLTVAPASLTFPDRTAGTVSPPQVVTVTNSGGTTVTFGLITVTGDFTFVSSCPASLAPGGSCPIDVRFAPLVAGPRSGTLSIASDAASGTLVVPLSGKGLPGAAGTLDVSPAAIDFGTQDVGTTSATRIVSVTNSGSAAVSFSVTVAAPFRLVPVPATLTPCASTLNAGGACSLALAFAPGAAGSFAGVLAIDSDASNPSVTVALSGTAGAATPRALSLAPRLDFGTRPVGVRSPALVLQVGNTSATPQTIIEVLASGDFSVGDACTVVPANGSCTIQVFMTPTQRGARAGVLTLRIASETQPYTVVLAGEGGANAVGTLTVSPARIGYGNTIVGPPVAHEAVTITNTGEVPVTLGALTVPGDFLLDSHCGATLAPGAACTIDVFFFPRLLGLRAGVLDIGSNAGNGPHRVELSGVGCTIFNVARTRIPQLVCSR